jgi:hypothetical protein
LFCDCYLTKFLKFSFFRTLNSDQINEKLKSYLKDEHDNQTIIDLMKSFVYMGKPVFADFISDQIDERIIDESSIRDKLFLREHHIYSNTIKFDWYFNLFCCRFL